MHITTNETLNVNIVNDELTVHITTHETLNVDIVNDVKVHIKMPL